MSEHFVIEETPDGRDLTVTGDWTPRASQALWNGEADGLNLNYAHGYRERSLDFFEDWPIRRLHVLARTLKDLTPTYRLAGTLEHLTIETDPRAPLDLVRLPRLVSLGATWSQVRDTVRYLPALEDLFLLSYREPDLRPLARNSTLRSLRMKDNPTVESLDGIDALTTLEELGIYADRELQDLTPLRTSAASQTLRKLDLQGCPRLGQLEDIATATTLRTLNISECRDIDTLAPVHALTRLETFLAYGSTRIVDGDLSPLLGLPKLTDVAMASRRHYRPGVAEIEAALPARQPSN